MKVIAFDPGKNTGYAIIQEGKATKTGSVIGEENLTDFLETLLPIFDFVVIEDYFIRPNTPHQWSKPVAIEAIGAIRSWAMRHGMMIKMQQPAIKPVGYGWIGAKYKKGKKDVHYLDALAHGYYFLIKNGYLRVEDVKR